MTKLSPLIQKFFYDRLINQQGVSQNTVSAYRDTFKIFLLYLKDQKGISPSDLNLKDITAELIGKFLNHLEKQRGNSIRSRNGRLAAIRSFFKYLSYQEPQYSGEIQRILNIRNKKFQQRMMTYLNNNEINAILSAPNQKVWIGRRDHALLLLAIQSGLRVSELINLTPKHIVFGTGSHVFCQGKGRKERCTPLTKQAEKVLKEWLRENKKPTSDSLFPSQRGGKLSRDAVEKLLKKYKDIASNTCQTLKEKNITPHTLRHTTAVHLLQAGVDTSLIALYLGHESIASTQVYLNADLETKEKALSKIILPKSTFRRFKPNNELMIFLEEL